MKLLYSKKINAFGGINLVLNELKKLKIEAVFTKHLPQLSAQSKYNWNDIFCSLLSIYFCGGSCIEDSKTVLAEQIGANPFFSLSSPDTIARRIKELSVPNEHCCTPRGTVEHSFNHNAAMANLTLDLLDKTGAFKNDKLVLDYDNTIIFSEKQDCKMTYKRDYGYQPGVCILNEQNIVFIENRQGNSAAKAFQDNTLQRMFKCLNQYTTGKEMYFRADAASYQFDVFNLLEENRCTFFIGARNSYVEKHYNQVKNWRLRKNQSEESWIGDIIFYPFTQRYMSSQNIKPYRLLVKCKPNKTGQINLVTGDAFEYRAVVTNDFDIDIESGLRFYEKRGNAEKQFDVMKNDFGWNNIPFSRLDQNNVFMYLTAICRNLYNILIRTLSERYSIINPKTRIKRFIFCLITKPAQWVKRSRQWHLRIYGNLQLRI